MEIVIRQQNLIFCFGTKDALSYPKLLLIIDLPLMYLCTLSIAVASRIVVNQTMI